MADETRRSPNPSPQPQPQPTQPPPDRRIERIYESVPDKPTQPPPPPPRREK